MKPKPVTQKNLKYLLINARFSEKSGLAELYVSYQTTGMRQRKILTHHVPFDVYTKRNPDLFTALNAIIETFSNAKN